MSISIITNRPGEHKIEIQKKIYKVLQKIIFEKNLREPKHKTNGCITS